jgi:PBP1b-binding outer membrane lipoprotein LpoB
MWTVIAALLSAGCAVKTRDTTYVDPDAYGAVEGTGIEARDVRTVATQMAGELLGSSALQDVPVSVPRLAVLPVKNRSRFLIDQEIFTTLITDLLIQNAAGQLAILNRDIVNEVLAEREMKRNGEVDAGPLTQMAGADFFL